MKQKTTLALIICLMGMAAAGCQRQTADVEQNVKGHQTLLAADTPEGQENTFPYQNFFLPKQQNGIQPYVGDVMPYYENGTYYMYYLKDGGDSVNHSIYLATSKDLLTYQEEEGPVLEAGGGGQDDWIGTGSLVKVKDAYYFFYTGHASSDDFEYKEKIMVAKGTSLLDFKKMEGWELVPPEELGQKQDFRDPQVYYDEKNDRLTMTVTASKDGKARILKYSLSSDLQTVDYDGIIFTDPVGGFWNLECSDSFQIGDSFYLTYSAQDDTLWYARSDSPYGPYSKPRRLDGKLFYAAKHTGDGENHYMAGWARRSQSPTSRQEVSAWAGNLEVQKIKQLPNKDLVLEPLPQAEDQFVNAKELPDSNFTVKAGKKEVYQEAFSAEDSFMLKGAFSYSGKGCFGLAFDYDGDQNTEKTISIDPKDQLARLDFNNRLTNITETAVKVKAGTEYSFTYIQEGSVGIFYLDNQAALTVRLYGVNGKSIRLFAQNNKVTFKNLCEYTR